MEFGCVVQRTVLEDSYAAVEGEMQPGQVRVAFFEFIDDAQRLQVVLESAVVAHARVERILPGMPEGRVPEVMRQADRLGQRFIQLQRARDGARDLRNLQ